LSRLVVVSNRVSTPRHARSGSQGGLAVALQSALEQLGGIWFGWSGEVRETPSRTPHTLDSGGVTYATVDLTQRDYDEYYNGFANRTLWPLFHYRLDLTEFSRRTMQGYQRVNQLFAERLLPLLAEDDILWIHDYHLIPLAERLREAGCRQRMGFFLHIPWPALEVFLALPNHRDVARALCAYDLVGFQTGNDLRGFHNYVALEAGGSVESDGTVRVFSRELRTGAFPISIDTGRVAAFAREAAGARQAKRLDPEDHAPILASATGATEQRQVQRRLQRFDMRADRGLGQVKRFRRPRQTPGPRRRSRRFADAAVPSEDSRG